MAHVLEDRVLETATTTGTSDFTLAGAVDRFRAFSAVCSTSDTFPYFIEGAAGTGEWETGIGTYSAANTLTRTAVRESSNAGAAVNFSAGTKRIGLSPIVKSGTAFPGTPVSGEVFRRSDRNIEYAHDGTRWLSTQLFQQGWQAFVGAAADAIDYGPIPYKGTYDIWMERLDISTWRNGSGEWDVHLEWGDGTVTTPVYTNIVTIDGAGLATNTWNAQSANINAVLNANARVFRLVGDETSGSSTLIQATVLNYRLVG